MNAEQQITEAGLGTAVAEYHAAAPEANFYFELALKKPNGATELTGSVSVNSLVSNFLTGAGNYSLVSFKVIYQTTAEKQGIQFALHSANKTPTKLQLGGMKNGHAFKSSSFNAGTLVDVEVVPPSIVSRQLQPVSAVQPAMHFTLHAHADINVWLQIELHVNTVVVRQEEVVFQ